ncbi:MAG: hypothetical protein H0U74_00010 [Bradymonadaceae bacterium]|nr:hypothetical protein [Lujinxingiaceae bacterium]
MSDNRYGHLRTGQAVAAGEFVLDQEQARKKLQEFQLVNPHDFVLEFVKAAHLLGAKAIDFTIDTDELGMRFDGKALSKRELSLLYSSPFSQRASARQQALRHLAIGVNAAQGLGLRELLIQAGGPSPHGVRLLGDQVEALDGLKPIEVATRIYLRERARPGHLVRFWDMLRDDLPEAQLLRERCLYSQIPISINGQRISHGHALAGEALAPVEITGDGVHGRLAMLVKAETITTHILQHGVLIATDVRPAELVGAHAIVDSARLSLNLSQSAFLEDAPWHALHEMLADRSLQSWALFLSELPTQHDDNRARSLDLLIPIIAKLSAVGARQAVAEAIEAIESLPLFAAATRPTEHSPANLSIAQARVTNPNSGRTLLFYASKPAAVGVALKSGAPVLVLPGTPEQYLGAYADEIIDVSEELGWRTTARANEAVWRARPWHLEPDRAVSFALHKSARFEDYAISVGIGRPQMACTLSYVKQGHLLEQRVLSVGQFGGLILEIGGDLEETYLFDAPRRTNRLEQASVAAIDLLIELIEESLSLLDAGWQLSYLEALVYGELKAALIEAFAWSAWPKGLPECLNGSDELVGDVGRLHIEKLGQIGGAQLFEDLHGRRYSLQSLFAKRHPKSIVYLPAENTAAVARYRHDERLADETVLLTPARELKLIRVFFGDQAVELAAYLAHLERERQRAQERLKAEVQREQHRLEEQRKAEERRAAEERRLLEEQREAEQRRAAERVALGERRRQAKEQREAETLRLAEERRLAQVRRTAEAQRKAEERRLIEVLIGPLRAQMLAGGALLEPHHVHELRLELADGKQAVSLHKQQIALDRAHPLVAFVVDYPDDVVARAFVASAVYGALGFEDAGAFVLGLTEAVEAG